MSSIEIKVKINIEEIIEIEIDDLVHQSIDEYMDYVRSNPHDYIDVDCGFDWELA